jgi:hypothetical protein
MNPLNKLESKLSAEEVVATGIVKSWLYPAIYILIGTCLGIVLTLILRH